MAWPAGRLFLTDMAALYLVAIQDTMLRLGSLSRNRGEAGAGLLGAHWKAIYARGRRTTASTLTSRLRFAALRALPGRTWSAMTGPALGRSSFTMGVIRTASHMAASATVSHIVPNYMLGTARPGRLRLISRSGVSRKATGRNGLPIARPWLALAGRDKGMFNILQ